MGEVKDAVKGDGLKKKVLQKPKIGGDNLVEHVDALLNEVSHCIQVKDEDTLKEGDDAKAENARKAATLRAVHSLMTTSKTLLEDY
ncbi:MAG: hypothetical protein ACXAC5_04245 [Promethearchaeota archaeon]|jgi:hypothetical protein